MSLEFGKKVCIFAILHSVLIVLAAVTGLGVLRGVIAFSCGIRVLLLSASLIDIIKEIKKDRHPPMTIGEYIDDCME